MQGRETDSASGCKTNWLVHYTIVTQEQGVVVSRVLHYGDIRVAKRRTTLAAYKSYGRVDLTSPNTLPTAMLTSREPVVSRGKRPDISQRRTKRTPRSNSSL